MDGMRLGRIDGFGDFCGLVRAVGFAPMECLTPYFGPGIRWHTGDPETDPWEWRVRAMGCGDLCYGKLFARKGGFIARPWYPLFLAARRRGSFEEAYGAGLLRYEAKRIHGALAGNGPLPVHELKTLAGFRREERAAFDAALTDLQMQLYAAMCGVTRKRNARGEAYGWQSTCFCLAEQLFPGALAEAEALDREEAAGRLEERLGEAFGLTGRAVQRLVGC